MWLPVTLNFTWTWLLPMQRNYTYLLLCSMTRFKVSYYNKISKKQRPVQGLLKRLSFTLSQVMGWWLSLLIVILTARYQYFAFVEDCSFNWYCSCLSSVPPCISWNIILKQVTNAFFHVFLKSLKLSSHLIHYNPQNFEILLINWKSSNKTTLPCMKTQDIEIQK